MFSTWFWIWFAFAFPVVLQGAFAYADGFLTARQVLESRGQGLPFLYHGGMWSDLFLFASLMAYVITAHAQKWIWWAIVAVIVVGFVASYAMHLFVYVLAGVAIPEAHTHDGALTTAGWIHLYYMAAGIVVMGLYYLGTPNLAPAEVYWVSGLLFAHFVIGTHVPFRAWARVARPEWYPTVPVVDLNTALTLLGLAVVLLVLSLWATR